MALTSVLSGVVYYLAAEGFALKLGDTVPMGAGGPETLSGVARDVLIAP